MVLHYFFSDIIKFSVYFVTTMLIASVNSFPNIYKPQINSADKFFHWMRHTFLPRLFPVSDIRGQAISVLDKQYFAGFSHARVGPALLRQSRMGICEYSSLIVEDSVVQVCL